MLLCNYLWHRFVCVCVCVYARVRVCVCVCGEGGVISAKQTSETVYDV